MSDQEFEGDYSDSSMEEIEIRPVRPPSRSRPVPVKRDKLTKSPVRSLSQNSVLNGDSLSAKICLEVGYFFNFFNLSDDNKKNNDSLHKSLGPGKILNTSIRN